MKKKFDEEFDEEEDLDAIPEELKTKIEGNTIELSNKGLSQEMIQEMNTNQLKIAKLKLKNLIKEKEQIKQYLKENLLTKGIKGLIKITEGK